MKDWAQTFWRCGTSDGKSWNPPDVPRLERNLYLRGSIHFNSKIVFIWLFVISLVMEAMGLPSPFFCFIHIVIRFLDTYLSLLICLSVIEVKTEGNRHRDVHYSWKTLKTSKMNGIVWVKKDKLTPYGEQRLQQINAGREDHHPSKRPLSN